jgi:hypothetical protein
MNSQQLFSCLNRGKITYQDFRGVSPRDMLLKQSKVLHGKNNSYVCNMAVKTDSGEHWVAIFISPQGEGEYFDSFGLHPITTFCTFLNDNCKSWVRNNIVQSTFSMVCGQYCVYFLHQRSNCESMRDILSMLKSVDSDSIVNTFVNKHFSGVGKHAVTDSRFIIQQISKEMNKVL